MLHIDRDRYGNPLPLLLYGSERFPANFLESFPSFGAGELADALGKGHNRCIWSWREDDAPFAYADFELLTDDIVKISLESTLAKRSEHRLAIISLRRATNYSDRRPFSLFLCPRCRRSCRHVVFTYRWHCKACSNLPYRRQRIGNKVAAHERRDALEKEVAGGRPKGMHHRVFEKKVQELNELQKKLSGPRAEVAREYFYTLDKLWLEWPSDAELEKRWKENKERRGNEGPSDPIAVMPWLGDAGSDVEDL
ncbi:hypothetical protein G7A66_03260 [Altererythrobacter sp. SALINAS58]|uniref:hypothetical protein n=1 Tax=Alteripontixanthobacter muriae TaxID=2705546 RepID=UPI0015767D70|nr:hypothetical protein [Alteripontixanthobacter muriae]NTZ42127.1 hypothetical protein [Alteripontixanthobacter muriae]